VYRDPNGPVVGAMPFVIFANRYRGRHGVIAHQHVGTELLLVTHGRGHVTVGGSRFAFAVGDVLVLPKRVEHAQEDDGEVETLYVEFEVGRRIFNDQARVLRADHEGHVAAWFEQLVALESRPVPLPLRGGLCLALLELLTYTERRDDAHRELPPGVASALRLIESDLLAPLSVEQLCRAAGLSASHLTALFRQHVGCGPMAWQQRQRLELACRLLRNHQLAIAEVASASGFSDANFFTRQFRKRHGCTPSDWRRKQRGAAG